MTNQEIAKIFYEISEYLEMEDEPFRPRAYNRAARIIELENRNIKTVYDQEGVSGLERIQGIGKEIAKNIEEFITTERSEYLEKLREESPVDVSTLTKIEGLGPKKIKALWKNLGVVDLKSLKKVLIKNIIKDLDGFGEKSQENILRGIHMLKKQKERLPLEKVIPIAEEIKSKLSKLSSVEKIEIAGSLRRKKKDIGDIDILVASSNPKEVMNAFSKLNGLEELHGQGETKSSGRLSIGIDVDLRVVPEKSFGSALQYFTGSQLHNIKLRRLAQKKGLKLSEYGLFKKDEQLAGKDEKEIYEKLGVRYVDPEQRTGENEIVITNTNIKEKSVGAIIFHETHDRERKNKYLILHYPPRNIADKKRTKPGHWDLVKGHVDEGETEIDTLFRETEEETGLKKEHLEIIKGFKEEIHYNFRTENGLHYKIVIFYLLKSTSKEIVLSYEHNDFKWLPFEKAYETITFAGGKEMLKKAHNFLNSRLKLND